MKARPRVFAVVTLALCCINAMGLDYAKLLLFEAEAAVSQRTPEHIISVPKVTRLANTSQHLPCLPVPKSSSPGNHNSWGRGHKVHLHVHKMPKAGSASFITELHNWLSETQIFKEVHVSFSEWVVTKRVAIGDGAEPPLNGLLLRRPLPHVISMYHHCQSPCSNGQTRHHYPSISLGDWIAFWSKTVADNLADDPRECKRWRPRFCVYTPYNFMTNRLNYMATVEPGRRVNHSQTEFNSRCPWLNADLTRAIAKVDAATFVGLTEFMRPSLCVAYYTLLGKLPNDRRCDCRVESEELDHNNHGVSAEDKAAETFTNAELESIHGVTTKDYRLYAHALEKFYADIRAIEHATGTPLLCDPLN